MNHNLYNNIKCYFIICVSILVCHKSNLTNILGRLYYCNNLLAKQEKSECLFVSFFCFNTSVSMAKVSVLLGRVVHDFMQISYFFVGFNFHCLGQEWLDFFFEFPYFLSDIPSAYIFWNFSNMNIFVENLSTLHVPSSLMNSKFSTGSITVGEEWGWLYQNQDKLVLNHPSNDEHKARKPKIKKMYTKQLSQNNIL